MIAAVAIVMGGLASFGETWTDAKGVTWDFYADYTDDNVLEAEITGVSPAPSGVLTIPSKVECQWGSCTVTTIGVSAFEARNAITAVSIPASVKVIDTCAFKGCTGLIGVVIPASVTNIDSYAFAVCSNLKSVTFKGDAPSFSDFHGAFEGTPFLAGLEARNGHDDRDNPKMISGTSGELKDENFAASCYGSGYDLINDFAPDGDATKWYEWTAPKSGTAWFWAQGNFNTFLGACTYDSIIMDDLAHNDNFNGKASAISFSVKAGKKYRIYVGGVRPRHLGSSTLKWRVGAPVNVTFDTCGGTINVDSCAAVFPVPKGATAGALPTATKEYYTLAGWYTKKSGGTKVTAKTKFSKATKLYAHWAKKKFKVAVMKGEGAKSVKGSGSYAWGSKVKLSATPKPGYVFWMWELNDLGDDVSKAAFPNFSKLCRKNLKPTVIVPKTSGISYRATFVKKSLDTLALEVLALPAKLVGAFNGYASIPGELGTGFGSLSRKVTVSVTSAGKVSAKIGSLSFSCSGLTYNSAGKKFNASMKSSVAKSKTVTYTRSLALEFDPAADYSENSLDGAYFEYTTKKTKSSVTEDLVAQYDVVGRRNVLVRDANGDFIFDGAELVDDALGLAQYYHSPATVPFYGGSVEVTIGADGVAKLVGTVDGKSFSESAVVWYEKTEVATMSLLTIYSFNIGMPICYVVTIVNDYAGPYVDNVAAPFVPPRLIGSRMLLV